MKAVFLKMSDFSRDIGSSFYAFPACAGTVEGRDVAPNGGKVKRENSFTSRSDVLIKIVQGIGEEQVKLKFVARLLNMKMFADWLCQQLDMLANK